MVDHVTYLNLLYDFYGQVLTERQQQIFQMYYLEDLSLGEIAEQLDISRQAVHDLVRRSERTLLDLEAKLQFVARFQQEQAILRQVRSELNALLEAASDSELAGKLRMILNRLNELDR